VSGILANDYIKRMPVKAANEIRLQSTGQNSTIKVAFARGAILSGSLSIGSSGGGTGGTGGMGAGGWGGSGGSGWGWPEPGGAAPQPNVLADVALNEAAAEMAEEVILLDVEGMNLEYMS
jgi:hypothetical protein